jgi:regulator of protease activity HflC (stomatin/prohibitin superfamily)
MAAKSKSQASSKNSFQWIIFLALLGLAALAFLAKVYALAIILLLYALSGIRVIYQYERGVLFTLGRFSGILDPGLVWIIPGIQSLRKVDLRIQSIDIPPQEVMTKDNVPVKVNGVVFFRVEQPEKAILNVQDYLRATALYAQTVLRDVIGNVELDELLQKREEIGEKIRKIVDEITDAWGIDVSGVRLQDITIPEEIKSAIARQAEAEREKRAVIIKSEGEVVAAKNLEKAAEILAKAPDAITLRILHTLTTIAASPSQKILIVLPTGLVRKIEKE